MQNGNIVAVASSKNIINFYACKQHMKKDIVYMIMILVVAAFLLAGCTNTAEPQVSAGEQTTSSAQESTNSEPSTETDTTLSVDDTQETSHQESTDTAQEVETSQTTIEISSSGFSPSTLTISKGTTVTFINRDSSTHQPASNPHPAHTGYPEEGTCSGSAFDSCNGLSQGESWSFTFDEVGTWRYHDHLNSGMAGTIIVQ